MNGPITLNAASGATDEVTVSKNVFGYSLSDSDGATAGTGCTQSNSTTVLCTTSIAGQVTLNLGDQLDFAQVDGTLPASTRVTINGETDGATVSSANAVNPLLVNVTAGDVTTGSASDTLNVGSATYTGTVNSGAGDDHMNLSTNMPNGYDPDTSSCLYGQVETCDPIDVYGGTGDDHIVMASTSTGAIYYNGEPGNDVVFGGNGADKFALQSDDGDDWYFGGGGNDYFLAYALTGTTMDHLFGEAGNDYADMWRDNGSIMFDGGPGTDKVIPHFDFSWTEGVNISLDGEMNDGEAAAVTDNYMNNVENITTGGIFTTWHNAGDDTLSGNAEANVIDGYAGNDDITGFAGADTLRGGEGNDTIHAKDGEADTVDCGNGSDTAYVDSVDTVNSNCETQL